MAPRSDTRFPVPGHLFSGGEPYVRKPPHMVDQASQHVEARDAADELRMHRQHEHPTATVDTGELPLPDLQDVAGGLNGAIVTPEAPLEEWCVIQKPADRQFDQWSSRAMVRVHVGEIIIHEIA